MTRRILPHAPRDEFENVALYVGEHVVDEGDGMLYVGDGTTPGGNPMRDPGTVVSLYTVLTSAEREDAQSGTPVIDLTDKVNDFLAENVHVVIPPGTYLVDYLNIPTTLLSMRALSKGVVTFKRGAAANGPMFSVPTGRSLSATFEGIYLWGNNEAGETYGFDVTGISYASFIECSARNFKLDGWYAKGLITPTVRQMSNNTFLNCTGNNNGRHGFGMEGASPLRYENTANVFIGGEFSGNGTDGAGFGIYNDVGDSNMYFGVCCQSNSGGYPADPIDTYGDIWMNSRYCIFQGYLEGMYKSVQFGEHAYGNEVKGRSTFPLWNTLGQDLGVSNKMSVMGEVLPEQHLFYNPHFAKRATASVIDSVTLQGTTYTMVTDTGSPFGESVRMTGYNDFDGWEITPVGMTATELQSRWVTVLLEMKTSGITDPLELQIHTRDGGTPNLTNGEYVVTPLEITTGYKLFAFDVRFEASISGSPTIFIAPWYDGATGASTIDIRSCRIVLGQTQGAGWPVLNMMDRGGLVNVITADITSAASTLNTQGKFIGKTILDTSSGLSYFALGTSPTSAWRKFVDNADTTPA